MALEKKDFFGKTVADAIKEACDTFQVPQENLNIEVIETGSSGIFGFIRKKAQIRVSLQEDAGVSEAEPEIAIQAEVKAPVQAEKAVAVASSASEQPPVVTQKAAVAPETIPQPQPEPAPVDESAQEVEGTGEEDEEDVPVVSSSDEPLSQESLDGVRQELAQLLQLMGIPSKVEIESQGSSVRCHVSNDFQEDLTGQEGKVLDSLQYLLRKIAAKKFSEKIRISIDVGDFREKRQDELEDQARELAALVKADGKTQIIPSLNPSERRVVHMALQDDKEIRSRSVGDGLFKKVLIYKPGKPKNNQNNGAASAKPKKRSSSRGRRGKGGKPPTENDKNE